MSSKTTAGWLAVTSGSGRLSSFRTKKTKRKQTKLPVNRRLGLEVGLKLDWMSFTYPAVALQFHHVLMFVFELHLPE